MAHMGRRGLSRSILLTFICITSFLQDAIGTQTWTVGDGFGWNRSPPISHDQWAAGKIIQLGDALLFSFNAGQHNVLEVTESNLASCVTSDPISSSAGDPTIIQLTTAGYHGFISGIPGDCANGMHLSLQVVSTSGPGGTPTSSPASAPPGPGGAPPPAGSPTPVGVPSNNGQGPVLSPSSASPPGSQPPIQPPQRSPAGSPPGGAPDIPSGSPLSNAPDSSPGPTASVPGSPSESTSPGPSPAGEVAAPPTPFSSPSSSPGSSPSPTPISSDSPLNDRIPPEFSPLASTPGSMLGSPTGSNASGGTSRHRLDLVGLVIMMVPALIFPLFR